MRELHRLHRISAAPPMGAEDNMEPGTARSQEQDLRGATRSGPPFSSVACSVAVFFAFTFGMASRVVTAPFPCAEGAAAVMMAVEQRRALRWALLVLTGSALLSPGACAEIKQPEGGEVTLEAKYTGDPSEINWKKDFNKVVDMELEPLLTHFYRLDDRATIRPTDGSLTIRNLTVGDSGRYMAEALVNNIIQDTHYDLTVIACPTKPTISDNSTKDKIDLICKCKTPGVKYEWWNQTRLVAQSALYIATRTREGGNLTCVVYVDKDMCKNEASIIIPPIPGPGRSRDGLIAVFIVVVVPVLAAALLVYFYCKKNQKPKSQPAGKQDEENPLIPPGSKQPDAEQGGHQVAKRAAEQITPEDRKSGSQSEEEQAENQDTTVPWNTPESPRSGSRPEEEQAKKQDFTEPRNTPESPRSGSQPEEEGVAVQVTQPAAAPRNIPSPRSGSQPEEEGVAVQVTQPAAAPRNTPVSKMGRLTLIPSFLGEVQHYTLQKVGNPSIKATLGELVDGQIGIESLCVTVEEVKTEDTDAYTAEDYTAEAHLSNGATWAISKEDSGCDTIIFDLPDTRDVTKVALKGRDVQWWWELGRLQSAKLTLGPSSVTINNLESKDSGTYKIDVHCAGNCIVSNTFKLEVVEVKHKREHRLKLVKVVTPENGRPANEPIGNITLHPIELTEEARVTWMKNDQQLDIEDGRIQLHPNGDLTINNVTSADKGTYSVHYKDQKLKQEFHLAF